MFDRAVVCGGHSQFCHALALITSAGRGITGMPGSGGAVSGVIPDTVQALPDDVRQYT